MAAEPVHYELFIRRNAQATWALECATESRSGAIAQAEETLSQGRAVGVKVCKESRRANGDYQSVVIFSKGDLEPPRRKSRVGEEKGAPLCVSPQDLYTVHARERIGRLLEGWLNRQKACPFELLHRPDLVERLEATGLELQHAMQKLAIPEAQAKGLTTHEVIRNYQKLVEDAIARLLGDARKGRFPDIARDGLPKALATASQAQEPAYAMGVAVAGAVAKSPTPAAKVAALLDLADAAPEGAGRGLLLQVLEQLLAEILSGPFVVSALAGPSSDLGSNLAMMVRLTSPEAVETLTRSDPSLARSVPPVGPDATRLERWLADPAFGAARKALARRVLSELQGPRRLHPGDPCAEIAMLRCLARLLVMSPDIASVETVQSVFIARSRRLLGADFIQSYVEQCGGGPLGEVQGLMRLTENVVGAVNKRTAAGWLKAAIGALRFERACATAQDGAAASLQRLADLQHALTRIGLERADCDAISETLGHVGEVVEAAAKLIGAVARAPGATLPRLSLLLRMASGDAAPTGPVSRRARLEVLKLIREPAVRAELAASPQEAERLRLMLQTAGMAA